LRKRRIKLLQKKNQLSSRKLKREDLGKVKIRVKTSLAIKQRKPLRLKLSPNNKKLNKN
tara:strand:+ start:450 stop:626 length:177 start_codon:yes stop_codon:yes gene_type:complete